MVKKEIIASALLILALTFTGCSASPSPSSTTGGDADVAAAEEQIAPYLEAPSEFPITEPLTTSVAGQKVAFLDCGTPVCGLAWSGVSAAAQVLSLDLQRINAGVQAESVSSAFDTVLQGDFDGVIDPALPNPLAEQGLEKLKDAGIPVVAGGVVNGTPGLIGASLGSEGPLRQLGEVLATYVVSAYGGGANIAFYVVPELELSKNIQDGFTAKMTDLCPSCTVRPVDISVTTLGTTAPSKVTDDLQAHPDTTLAVFEIGEIAIGLPAAMKAAGLTVPVIAGAPSPDGLQQIKNGDMVAGIGYDNVFLNWEMVDALARLMSGQDLDPAEVTDVIPMQVLTADDITDEMVKNGWTGFGDYAERFTQLWTGH